VDFGTFDIGGEFDSGDYGEGRAARGVHRRVERGGRIVIGNGNDVQPAFNRELDKLRGREFAIRRVGVRVEIDAAGGAV
jgi:hypothetical protein